MLGIEALNLGSEFIFAAPVFRVLGFECVYLVEQGLFFGRDILHGLPYGLTRFLLGIAKCGLKVFNLGDALVVSVRGLLASALKFLSDGILIRDLGLKRRDL